MVDRQKRYVGSYADEEEAARKYDVAAIQNHGEKAKTNFFYSESEIQRIKSLNQILPSLEKKSHLRKRCSCCEGASGKNSVDSSKWQNVVTRVGKKY